MDAPADRLRAALDLHDLGVDLVRRRLQREDPGAAPEILEERVLAWLTDRPLPTLGGTARVVWPR